MEQLWAYELKRVEMEIGLIVNDNRFDGDVPSFLADGSRTVSVTS